MPLFRKAEPEADADPRAEDAQTRPHTLTLELLDWLIAALEAVLQTPQLRDISDRRAVASLRDALKYTDHLYPLTREVANAKEPALSGSEVLPGAVGGDEADEGGRDV